MSDSEKMDSKTEGQCGKRLKGKRRIIKEKCV